MHTLPHLLGVICGYPVLFDAAGLGLGALTITGAVYLLWLAWRIAFAPAALKGGGNTRPLTFPQAAASSGSIRKAG